MFLHLKFSFWAIFWAALLPSCMANRSVGEGMSPSKRHYILNDFGVFCKGGSEKKPETYHNTDIDPPVAAYPIAEFYLISAPEERQILPDKHRLEAI